MRRICPKCEAEREFRHEERREEYTVRGLPVSFPVVVEVCETCGEDLYDEARDADLVEQAYAQYRREKGLLFPHEIAQIRNRYNLSQKSLAAVLGMSEATINRYENGGLQEDSHDNAIRLAARVEAMESLLERRGHLLSEWQRRRAMQAIETQLAGHTHCVTWMMPKGASEKTGGREFDYERYAGAVVWFCHTLGMVYRTQLNKLLFYADFLSFKHYALSITGAAYRKIQYGPVPADFGGLEDAMESDDLIRIEEGMWPNGVEYYRIGPGPTATQLRIMFTKEEQRVLSTVAQEFRGDGAQTLTKRSHAEDAFTQTLDREIISYQHAATLSLSLPEGEGSDANRSA